MGVNDIGMLQIFAVIELPLETNTLSECLSDYLGSNEIPCGCFFCNPGRS